MFKLSDPVLVAALAAQGVEATADRLVLEAAGDVCGLGAEAARLAGSAEARSIVLVATPDGLGWDALQGVTRSLAAARAPQARVNAVAPSRPGAGMDPAQTAAAIGYLLGAEAVTGATVFVGAP